MAGCARITNFHATLKLLGQIIEWNLNPKVYSDIVRVYLFLIYVSGAGAGGGVKHLNNVNFDGTQSTLFFPRRQLNFMTLGACGNYTPHKHEEKLRILRALTLKYSI